MYTTTELIEAYLGRTLTSEESARISSLQSLVKSWIDGQIGGSFYTETAPTASTRYYDGGVKILDIEPCISISKVAQVDTDESELYVYELNTEFESRPRNKDVKRWIEKRGGAFPRGVANIAVTGVFTLGLLPEDIKQIATIMVGGVIIEGTTGAIVSESIEGYSRTFADSTKTGGISKSSLLIKDVLSKYTFEDETPFI